MAAKLALDGGSPVVTPDMIRTWPPLTQADRDTVLRVFDNNQLHTNSAPFAVELQERWAAFCGVRYCLATNGGTGALHTALAAAGVQPGDEVITSAYSFWATAGAVLHQNAIPIFVDVDPRTGTMDPGAIEAALTERTTALMPVHIHGMPADMDPIMAIARQHHLVVIGDCCQGHGARYKGRVVGGIEDIAGFSLNRSKNLSAGEGGLVTTDNPDFFRCAEAMQGFGNIEVDGPDGGRVFSALGWNYRPHELVNALAVSQLNQFEANNDARRAFSRFLTGALEELPGVAGPYEPEYADPCYWTYLFDARPQDLGLDMPPKQFRGALLQALAAEGLPVGGAQAVPVPGEVVFGTKIGRGRGCPWTCRFGRDVTYRAEDYPVSQAICDSWSLLWGVYPPNDMALMQRYAEGFAKVAENRTRLIELAQA